MGSALARFARMLVGLAVVAGALVMGLLLALGLMLRVGWLLVTNRHRTPAAPAGRTGPRRFATAGEVVDIEAREVPPQPR